MSTTRRIAPLAAFAIASLGASLLLFGGHRISLSGAATSAAGRGPDLTALPLGDGKTTTTSPQRGYLFECHVQAGGGGAGTNGPWIHGSTYDLTAKYVVDGSVDWPAATFSAKVKKNRLRISGNGLPKHTTGTYPVASTDDAYQIDRNPNRIASHTVSESFKAIPKRNKRPTCTGGQVGVMKSGALLFNAVDGENRGAVAHEVQDSCSGHPERTGAYHYHGLPSCIGFGSTSKHSKVIGWALDGFPIYGPYGDGGNYLSNAELDACHGTTEKIKYEGEVRNSFTTSRTTSSRTPSAASGERRSAPGRS